MELTNNQLRVPDWVAQKAAADQRKKEAAKRSRVQSAAKRQGWTLTHEPGMRFKPWLINESPEVTSKLIPLVGFKTLDEAAAYIATQAAAKAQQARSAQAKAKAKATSEAKAAARAGRPCGACGKVMNSTRSTKQFCNATCRSRGFRAAEAA